MEGIDGDFYIKKEVRHRHQRHGIENEMDDAEVCMLYKFTMDEVTYMQPLITCPTLQYYILIKLHNLN